MKSSPYRDIIEKDIVGVTRNRKMRNRSPLHPYLQPGFIFDLEDKDKAHFFRIDGKLKIAGSCWVRDKEVWMDVLWKLSELGWWSVRPFTFHYKVYQN